MPVFALKDTYGNKCTQMLQNFERLSAEYFVAERLPSKQGYILSFAGCCRTVSKRLFQLIILPDVYKTTYFLLENDFPHLSVERYTFLNLGRLRSGHLGLHSSNLSFWMTFSLPLLFSDSCCKCGSY